MSADTKQHSGSFDRTWWRVAAVVWVAGLLAVLVAWLAAAPASAQAPSRDGTVFVHSAGSGKLGGGRLTLYGVGRRVTWAHQSGRSGVIAVKRMHRMLFRRESPAATGILHVVGHHGGDELTFKLSRPRYNRERRTVSYKVMRMRGGLPSRGAQAAGAPRRFGPASLSMVGAQQGSVTVQQNTYGCANTDPSNPTCWGILTASGLKPGAHLYVNVNFSSGGTQQYDWGDAVDQNGNISPEQPIYLQLPCTNNFNNTGTITSVQATAASGQSISLGGISPPAGYCD
jgi:hypothetical protein